MSENCDYDTTKGYSMQDGLGCIKGIATNKVTITYCPNTKPDEVKICDNCLKRLRVLIRKDNLKAKRAGHRKTQIDVDPILPKNLDATEEFFGRKYPLMFRR